MESVNCIVGYVATTGHHKSRSSKEVILVQKGSYRKEQVVIYISVSFVCQNTHFVNYLSLFSASREVYVY